MSQVPFPLSNFTYPSGEPIANGLVTVSISNDCRAPIPVPTDPSQVKNLLMSTYGLVSNSYNNTAGRQDYFPGTSGTSESQFLVILGMLEAYAATGNAGALKMATLALSNVLPVVYRNYPIPSTVSTTGIFAPHWLFDVKAPFISSAIRYEDEFVFSNGVCVVPDTYGDVRYIFQAMSPGYQLIYQSPYSPPSSGTAYPVASYVYDANQGGTVVTLADSSFNGSLAVIYSCLSGPVIELLQPFEAFPDWRPLAVGEIDSACDTYNWAYRSFLLAAQYVAGPWADAARATLQQADIVYPVNNQREWIAPSIQLQPFSQSGAFSYTDNVPAPDYYCNNAGSIVIICTETPKSGTVTQFGVAAIEDTFAACDTVTWNFKLSTESIAGAVGVAEVQLFIDTTDQQPYDPANRYVYSQTADVGINYSIPITVSQFLNDAGTPLAAGSTVYTCGVQIPGKMPVGLSITINSVNATPNLSVLYEGGCIPFTANFLGNPATLIGWQGPSYAGYQSPWMFKQLGNETNTATNVQFLADAQAAWTAQSATQDSGPFCPVFYFDKPDAVTYGPVNTFGWNGPDPNTEWVGYQVRPLAELAELVLACDGSEPYYSQAVSVSNTFLTWFDTNWPSDNVTAGPPSIFPQTGAQVTYPEPHAIALIVRACIKMMQAGQNNDAYSSLITKAISFWSYWYQTSGAMAGTFCTDTVDLSWYGFWHGEILRTLSDVYTFYQTSQPSIAAQALTWITGMITWGADNVIDVPTGKQVCRGMEAQIPLDPNGVPKSSPVFWPNALLSPPNLLYGVKIYSSDGQLVSDSWLTI